MSGPEAVGGGAREPLSKVILPHRVQVFLVRQGEHGLEFLLGHRTSGVFLGQWSALGGGLEGNETTRQAAIREVREEGGVELKDKDLIFFRRTHTSIIEQQDGIRVISRKIPIVAYVVWADNLNPFNNSPQEHDQLKWVNPTDTDVLLNQVKQGMKATTEDEEFFMPDIIAFSTLDTMLKIATSQFANGRKGQINYR